MSQLSLPKPLRACYNSCFHFMDQASEVKSLAQVPQLEGMGENSNS